MRAEIVCRHCRRRPGLKRFGGGGHCLWGLRTGHVSVDSGLVVLEGCEHLPGQPNHRALPLLRPLARKSELNLEQRGTNPWRVHRDHHPVRVVEALHFACAAEISKERVDIVDCRLYFNFHYAPSGNSRGITASAFSCSFTKLAESRPSWSAAFIGARS